MPHIIRLIGSRRTYLYPWLCSRSAGSSVIVDFLNRHNIRIYGGVVSALFLFGPVHNFLCEQWGGRESEIIPQAVVDTEITQVNADRIFFSSLV